MARRKTTRRRSTATSTGKKLIPTIKKQGLLKGSGMFAAKQTGISAMKKIVPPFLSWENSPIPLYPTALC
jgi:molybdenum cofactor biosynthesis enzyme